MSILTRIMNHLKSYPLWKYKINIFARQTLWHFIKAKQTTLKVDGPDINTVEIKAICSDVYRLYKDYVVIR